MVKTKPPFPSFKIFFWIDFPFFFFLDPRTHANAISIQSLQHKPQSSSSDDKKKSGGWASSGKPTSSSEKDRERAPSFKFGEAATVRSVDKLLLSQRLTMSPSSIGNAGKLQSQSQQPSPSKPTPAPAPVPSSAASAKYEFFCQKCQKDSPSKFCTTCGSKTIPKPPGSQPAQQQQPQQSQSAAVAQPRPLQASQKPQTTTPSALTTSTAPGDFFCQQCSAKRPTKFCMVCGGKTVPTSSLSAPVTNSGSGRKSPAPPEPQQQQHQHQHQHVSDELDEFLKNYNLVPETVHSLRSQGVTFDNIGGLTRKDIQEFKIKGQELEEVVK